MLQQRAPPSRPLCVERPRHLLLLARSASCAQLRGPEQRPPPPPQAVQLHLDQDRERRLQVDLVRLLVLQRQEPDDRAFVQLFEVAHGHDQEELSDLIPPLTATASR